MMQGMALMLGGYTSAKAAICNLHNVTSLSLLAYILPIVESLSEYTNKLRRSVQRTRPGNRARKLWEHSQTLHRTRYSAGCR